MRAQRIIDAGIRLNIVGGSLSVTSNQQLSEEQRQYIREHKYTLLDELKNSANAATEKLQQISQEQDWPLSELLDWYKNDLTELAGMDMAKVRLIVQDYIENIDLGLSIKQTKV